MSRINAIQSGQLIQNLRAQRIVNTHNHDCFLSDTDAGQAHVADVYIVFLQRASYLGHHAGLVFMASKEHHGYGIEVNRVRIDLGNQWFVVN